MEKGQIVRKMLSTGEPVGSYCMIIGFKGIKSSLVRLKSMDGIVDGYIKRERVYVCRQCKTIISDRVFKRLEKGLQHSIIHDTTPKWIQMHDKDPEVIQFRSELYSERIMIFTVENIRKVYYNNSTCQIRLDLGYRIL